MNRQVRIYHHSKKRGEKIRLLTFMTFMNKNGMKKH